MCRGKHFQKEFRKMKQFKIIDSIPQTVFAAPSTSTHSIEQLTYNLSGSIQCAYDSVVKLVNNAELKNELNELKRAIEAIRKEFKLCTTNADGRVVELIKYDAFRMCFACIRLINWYSIIFFRCKALGTLIFLEAKINFLRDVTAVGLWQRFVTQRHDRFKENFFVKQMYRILICRKIGNWPRKFAKK